MCKWLVDGGMGVCGGEGTIGSMVGFSIVIRRSHHLACVSKTIDPTQFFSVFFVRLSLFEICMFLLLSVARPVPVNKQQLNPAPPARAARG